MLYSTGADLLHELYLGPVSLPMNAHSAGLSAAGLSFAHCPDLDTSFLDYLSSATTSVLL